jgi:hypothetical protein
VLLYDDQQSEARFAGMDQISDASIQNKRAYCEKHGYSLKIADGQMIDRSRPAAWSKVLALRHYLPQFDWVLFMDTDTLVMNPEIRVESLIDERYDVIISEDWSGVNTGVFLMRNSTWSWWLLDEVWKQHQLVSGNYPFEYEQRAFHFLLQTSVWRARGLSRCESARATTREKRTHFTNRPRRYPGAPEVRRHFKVIPQCALNSYMLSPFTLRGDRATSQYVQGDFVVHMAGHKGYNKARLFEHAQRQAEAGLARERPRRPRKWLRRRR